jgi:hypothetical protein
MNLFRQLDATYQHLTARPRPAWLATIVNGGLDDVVTAIRDDRPDTAASDTTLRTLLDLASEYPDALTVAMHALAPQLRARLSRSVTDDYRGDVLTDLALVLLDSPLEGPRLARRLVNRAHNRTYKAARSAYVRGLVNVTTITPHDPQRFVRQRDGGEDIATVVARRVDLARFHTAVRAAIHNGHLSESAWAAYRDHRLARVVDPDARLCSSHERTTASRTARKLEPLIDSHLHTA